MNLNTMNLQTVTLSEIAVTSVKHTVHLRAHDLQATYIILETAHDKQKPYTFLMFEHSDPEEEPIISISCATHHEAAHLVIDQYCEDNAEAA